MCPEERDASRAAARHGLYIVSTVCTTAPCVPCVCSNLAGGPTGAGDPGALAAENDALRSEVRRLRDALASTADQLAATQRKLAAVERISQDES